MIARDESLVQIARAGSRDAWSTLAEEMRGVLEREAAYWATRGRVSAADLLQEGHLGLRRAIDTFNPRRGVFHQHAWAWIRKFMQQAVQQEAAAPVPVESVPEREDPRNVVDDLVRMRLSMEASRAVFAAATTVQDKAIVDHRLVTESPKSLSQVSQLLGMSPAGVHAAERRLIARAALEWSDKET